MKNSLWICSMIGLLLSQVLSACAPQASATDNPILGNVTMPGTEVRQLKSAETGRNYDIYIRLPESYAKDKKKKYPILYLLDGQWDFKLLDSIYGGLYYDNYIPEMIIVSVTYSGDHPDYETLRAMDYTPVVDPTIPGSGDAPKFHAFLKEELIPMIEANYRVNPSRRVLMGHSFGGTFTLYALFSEPELFSDYVAGSPAVTYGGQFAFDQEAEYAGSHKDLPVRLYVFVGAEERLDYPVEQFIQVVRERNYTGLEMETRTLEDERHAGVKPEGFNRGLRFIFQGK
jgi:uncharacterized protein